MMNKDKFHNELTLSIGNEVLGNKPIDVKVNDISRLQKGLARMTWTAFTKVVMMILR